MAELCLIVICALCLDGLLGEPRRAHPLVGFGYLADLVQKLLNTPASDSRLKTSTALWHKVKGGIALIVLLLPLTLLVYFLGTFSADSHLAINILILYLALGGRSLIEHAQTVRQALQEQDQEKARIATSYLVSRDTATMQNNDMAKATIESSLENGCDAVFAPLFWFFLAGAPAVVLYRLCNTLDAMWGYKTDQFRHFGWAAARLDDVLNYVPARLTALSYALCGHFANALRCWKTQAPLWKSPNAGPVMAAGAGALSLQLGGTARYHGQETQRPSLGLGSEPTSDNITDAINLLLRSIFLWIGILLLLWGGSSFA